jgi:2-dehydro-3-deoxyglucarate aldolase/4-hydroxy-2-oxoheptanedioate aldolase
LPWANANTTVICQIESTDGLRNLDAIAGTPGVDVLWVGHGDLANSMGIVGQFHHPDFRAAMRAVVAACRRRGIAAGIQPGTMTLAQEWLGIGFNVVSYSNDIRVYAAALARGISDLRALAAAHSDYEP